MLMMSTSSKGAEWREAGKTKVLSAGATLGFNFELIVVFTSFLMIPRTVLLFRYTKLLASTYPSLFSFQLMQHPIINLENLDDLYLS